MEDSNKSWEWRAIQVCTCIVSLRKQFSDYMYLIEDNAQAYVMYW